MDNIFSNFESDIWLIFTNINILQSIFSIETRSVNMSFFVFFAIIVQIIVIVNFLKNLELCLDLFEMLWQCVTNWGLS